MAALSVSQSVIYERVGPVLKWREEIITTLHVSRVCVCSKRQVFLLDLVCYYSS